VSRTPTEDIALLPDYFPERLLRITSQVIDALAAATDTILPLSFGPGLAVNEARVQLSTFLRSRARSETVSALFPTDASSLSGSLLKHEYGDARASVRQLQRADPGTLAPVSEGLIATALTREGVEYFGTTGKDSAEPDLGFWRTLPGYAGPNLTAVQRSAIVELSRFVTTGTDRSVRLALLDAECLMGLREYTQTVSAYRTLMSMDGLTDGQRKFMAIKAAYAQLAAADVAYRGLERVTAANREPVVTLYDAATDLLAERRVRFDDPDAITIGARVSRARHQLMGGFNVLGLRDSFVPVQRYSRLAELSRERVQACLSSAAAFVLELTRAEEEIDRQFDLVAEIAAEKITGGIATLQFLNATLGEDQIAERIEMLKEQKNSLMIQSAISVGTSVAFAAGSGGTAIAGVVAAGVSFRAQSNELGHQMAMARLEQRVAANQTSIAILQQQLSSDRLAHLGRKAQFLADRRMNPDFLYLRSALHEQRAYRQLEGAILLAYLYERALAFFLGRPEIKHIRFDYLDTQPDVEIAARQLEEDFGRVADEEASLDIAQSGGFPAQLSLRREYPLQFQRFLESEDGRLDFVYSLYQLSKRFPATHQCRLYHVGIEVKGLVGAGELRGTLLHDGRFLVRDRQNTLSTSTIRLVPTDEQLAAAIAEQEGTGTAAAAVQGTLFYALPDPDVLDLGLTSNFVPPPPDTITLSTFEGHGPTGLWSLQVEDHRRLKITDIVLHLGIVNRQSDPGALRTKVQSLTRAYETELAEGDALDRVDVISLRQQFPDTFFELENGEAVLTLNPDAFDPELENMQVKAVVLQAIDSDGAGLPGIRLEIRRDEAGFAHRRVTGAGGFSEDLDGALELLAPPDRVSVLGSWQLLVPNPNEFAQLDDLRLLLMYAYTEAQG
jgi:hypothetical protein